jgi:AraC-like DNA-binding protein
MKDQGRLAGLERSCGDGGRDWVRIGTSRQGFERVEARFAGHAFEPHRHDTYAVGLTLLGVQSFGYRGAEAHSLAGQAFILHPDELHDGHAGTEAGFRYRILYVEPRLIQAALGGTRCKLPFVREPVTAGGRLRAAIRAALEDFDVPLEDLRREQILIELADALSAQDRSAVALPADAPSLRAVRMTREFLDANLFDVVASEELERLTGLTRFALARHFRACLGTSPHRYVVMRRLDHARRLIQSGVPLAGAAADSGFADQAHLTRHFRKAYGLSPGRWRRMVRGAA